MTIMLGTTEVLCDFTVCEHHLVDIGCSVRPRIWYALGDHGHGKYCLCPDHAILKRCQRSPLCKVYCCLHQLGHLQNATAISVLGCCIKMPFCGSMALNSCSTMHSTRNCAIAQYAHSFCVFDTWLAPMANDVIVTIHIGEHGAAELCRPSCERANKVWLVLIFYGRQSHSTRQDTPQKCFVMLEALKLGY